MEIIGFIGGDGCYVFYFCFRRYVVVGMVLFRCVCGNDCRYDFRVNFGNSD